MGEKLKPAICFNSDFFEVLTGLTVCGGGTLGLADTTAISFGGFFVIRIAFHIADQTLFLT